MPVIPDEFLSRVVGAMLGMAAGDALGAPVEFMTTGEISARYGSLNEMVGGGWLRLKPGQVTDDTEMSLCIARAVCREGKWDIKSIADSFVGWLRSKPVDVGDTCRRGIRNYMLHGALETAPNRWDAGNGALMRMVPVAIFSCNDDELLERCVIEQAHITHNNPLSDAACLCYGRLLHLACGGCSKSRLRREVNALISRSPVFAFEPYRGLSTGYVVDTFQTVCHHFFRSRNFEECIVAAVNQGGDADTAGAIAGGLAGAYYGAEMIPKRWIKQMDRKLVAELSELSTQLCRISITRQRLG